MDARRLFPLLLFALLPILQVRGQPSGRGSVGVADGITVRLSGAIQARSTLGFETPDAGDAETRLGFGVRRARLRFDTSFPAGAGVFVHFDASGGTASVLDLLGRYRASERWSFRLGRMSSASPRGQMTSFSLIDVVDRPAVVERWAAMTIGAESRDFGFEAAFGDGMTEAVLFLHNGDGDWGRARGNYKAVISRGDALDGRQGTGMAVTAALARQVPGRFGPEIGAFAGVNHSRNPLTERHGVGRAVTSGGIHAYWGSDPGSLPSRIKVETLVLSFEALPGEAHGQRAVGWSVLAARRVMPGTEILARVEQFDLDTRDAARAERYLSAVVVFSPSARRGEAFRRERITLGWQRGDAPGLPRADMAVMQLQLVF